MRAVPVPFAAFVQWTIFHAQRWRESAARIGVPAPVAEGFADASERVQRASAALEAAKWALIEAQAEKDAAEAEARRQAGFIVAMIRAFAASNLGSGQDAQAKIFELAAIDPVRVSSTPLPPPAPALGHSATINGNSGHLTLRWDARQPRNARGTIYQVQRVWVDAATREQKDALLGHTAGRTFTDTSLPPGAIDVRYVVTAQRGRQSAPGMVVPVAVAARRLAA